MIQNLTILATLNGILYKIYYSNSTLLKVLQKQFIGIVSCAIIHSRSTMTDILVLQKGMAIVFGLKEICMTIICNHDLSKEQDSILISISIDMSLVALSDTQIRGMTIRSLLIPSGVIWPAPDRLMGQSITY